MKPTVNEEDGRKEHQQSYYRSIHIAMKLTNSLLTDVEL